LPFYFFRASISLSFSSVSLAAACFSSSVFGCSSVPSGSIEDEDEVEISPPIGWKDPFRETASGYLHSCSIYQGPTTPLDIILEVCCLWLVVSLVSRLLFDELHFPLPPPCLFPLCPYLSQISINGGAASRCNLKDFKDINTLLFQNASFCFRFTFQLPDPNYEEKSHLSQGPSNLVARTPQKLWVSHRDLPSLSSFRLSSFSLSFPSFCESATRTHRTQPPYSHSSRTALVFPVPRRETNKTVPFDHFIYSGWRHEGVL
jgi:hypothetical protein